MSIQALAILTLGGVLTIGMAPSTARYRVDQTAEQTVDSTAAGGGQHRQHVAIATFLTVTLTDTIGGKVVSAVIDSVRADSTPVPKAVLDSARGTPVHGLLGADGHVTGVKALRETPLGDHLTEVVTRLYGGLRPRLKQGDAWADTMEASKPTTGGSVSLQQITTYKTTAGEKRRGVAALRVETKLASRLSGTQQTAQGATAIEGSGSGAGTHYVSIDGRYLGGSSTLTTKLTLSGGAAPNPVPVTLVETFAVSELP